MIIDLTDNSSYAKYGNHGALMINFQVKFLDPNINPSIFVEVSDPATVYSMENMSSAFLQSIAMANTYQVLPSDTTDIYLSRNIRKFIIPSWKATMGLTPDYEITTYLTTRKTTERFSTTQFASMFIISIYAEYDKTIIETEESSLGLLGGAWSIAIVAYKLLFEKEINDLELFLRDYVVEVQQLDKVYENFETNKNNKNI
ncbi:21769_t:CDS:2 [Dentiscutata erythropus]|uniref:21769_t:CDS:1 n=1 Tax=Dentiscutata erythropus TaxID=1348616 RepID=A0A9N9HF88_9GLOM|nr:21769_t:CDS:2 [Dentiscutata erythropus]